MERTKKRVRRKKEKYANILKGGECTRVRWNRKEKERDKETSEEKRSRKIGEVKRE